MVISYEIFPRLKERERENHKKTQHIEGIPDRWVQ
jgi:hypothetical protein